jgi:formate hydrogenlyase subunit 6/NADH:ubiquinone oxidoreductase subunit I
LWDTIVTLLKGLGVTGKNLWRVVVQRQAVTITEQWGSRPIALRYRGTIGLTIDRRTGKENCIGCLACERICPDHCIHIETVDDCPVPALIHTEVWQVGGYSHRDLVFDKQRLLEIGEWQQEKWIRVGLGTVDQVTGKKSMQMTDEEWQAEEEKKRAAAAARAQRAAAARQQTARPAAERHGKATAKQEESKPEETATEG